MALDSATNIVATWFGIAATAVGGAVWVGTQSNEIANMKQEVSVHAAKIEPVALDIAVLKNQMATIQSDLKDIKTSQNVILTEVRKEK